MWHVIPVPVTVLLLMSMLMTMTMATASLGLSTSDGLKFEVMDDPTNPKAPVPYEKYNALLQRVLDIEALFPCVNVDFSSLHNVTISCSGVGFDKTCSFAAHNGTAFLASAGNVISCSPVALPTPLYEAKGCFELLSQGAPEGVYTFTTEYGVYDLDCFNDATYGVGWTRLTPSLISQMKRWPSCSGDNLINPSSIFLNCNYNAEGSAQHCGCGFTTTFKIFVSEFRQSSSPATTSAAGSESPDSSTMLYSAFPNESGSYHYPGHKPICTEDCTIIQTSGTSYQFSNPSPGFVFMHIGMKKYTSNPKTATINHMWR